MTDCKKVFGKKVLNFKAQTLLFLDPGCFFTPSFSSTVDGRRKKRTGHLGSHSVKLQVATKEVLSNAEDGYKVTYLTRTVGRKKKRIYLKHKERQKVVQHLCHLYPDGERYGAGFDKKIEIDQLYCTADRMCIKHYQERYLIYHNINTCLFHWKTEVISFSSQLVDFLVPPVHDPCQGVHLDRGVVGEVEAAEGGESQRAVMKKI